MLRPVNVVIQVWTVRCSHNLLSQWFPATLLLLVWCHKINIISFYQIRGGQMKHMFSWCTWKLWNLLDWLLTSRMQECSDECLPQPNTCRRCAQWLLDIHQTEQEIRTLLCQVHARRNIEETWHSVQTAHMTVNAAFTHAAHTNKQQCLQN